MERWLTALGLVACTSATSDKVGSGGTPTTVATTPAATTETPPTTHTTPTTASTPTTTALVSAECALQDDNTLRARCTVLTEPPGPVVVEVTPEGAPPLRVEAPSGELGVWALVADVPHTWRAWPAESPADVLSGELTPTSGPLLLEAAVTVPGRPALDAVLTQFGCTGGERIVVVDTNGRIRWYEDPHRLRPETIRVRGYEVTEDDTVLAVYDNDALVELAWTGEVLLDVRRPADRAFHHDAARRAGLTFALDAREAPYGELGPVVWDGFTVFDADGVELASWDTRGWLRPEDGNPCCGDYWWSDFPGAFDFAHANAIAVDDDLNVYVSYRYIDTLHKVVGDPLAPDFGQVEWTLVGDPDSPVPSDFVLVDPVMGDPTFGSPHHVRPLPGGIGVYDNGWLRGEPTRLLELALDGDTATVTTAVDLGLRCPIQGSAFPLPDGQFLTVCSGDGSIFVVDPATGERTWELLLSCPDGTDPRDPYRAVPVRLP